MTDNTAAAEFHARLNGRFDGVMQWHELDELFARVKSGAWYFYQIGESLPALALQGDELARRADELNALLRREHDYHYCGIVYADNIEHPTLIKVYDPNNLGSSCSVGAAPVLPGWVLSTASPALIETQVPVPASRRRWWQLF